MASQFNREEEQPSLTLDLLNGPDCFQEHGSSSSPRIQSKGSTAARIGSTSSDADIKEPDCDLGEGFGRQPGSITGDAHHTANSLNSPDTSDDDAVPTAAAMSSSGRQAESGQSSSRWHRLLQQLKPSLVASQRSTSSSLHSSENRQYYTDNKTEVKGKLALAESEVKKLEHDLEACQKKLESKYRAIEILQKQAYLTKLTERFKSEVSFCEKRELEKEVNSLQFELGYTFSNAMQSERTWGDRFNRISLENATLKAQLKKQTETLKKLKDEKLAVAQSRDELIARMDVKEKLAYERYQSSPEVIDTPWSLAELSVMGACRCRIRDPEPCGCAQTAAHLKRSKQVLQDRLDQLQTSLEEVYLVVDVYRSAFEEQLGRNRLLTSRLAKLTEKKTISLLNRTMSLPSKSARGGNWRGGHRSNGHKQDLSATDVDDIVTSLTEMLSDKCEALTHQKVITKVLANRGKSDYQSSSSLSSLDPPQSSTTKDNS